MANYTVEDILFMKYQLELALAIIATIAAIGVSVLYVTFPFSQRQRDKWQQKYDSIKKQKGKEMWRYGGFFLKFLFRIILPCVIALFSVAGLLDFSGGVDLTHVIMLAFNIILSVFAVRSMLKLIKSLSGNKAA